MKITEGILPAGWIGLALEDVAEIHDNLREPVNSSERAKRPGIYPYYGATGQVGWIDDFRQDGEYVLLGEDGAPFFEPTKEKAYLVSGKCWVNNHAHVLKGHEGLCSNRYLLYALNQTNYRGYANGTTRLKLTQSAMRQLPIHLAPLNEQNRIVAKIEELFSELDKGIENLKTARAQLKVYRQALLKHAFSGKGLAQKRIIAKPFGEEYFLTLGDVIQTLGQGWSPRCLETPSKSDDVWGVIRTTAIQPLHFDDTKNKQLPIGLTPRQHLEIIPGDVLITRAGPRTRVGIACFVKNTRPKLMVCDKAYRLRVHKEKILPQYLVMLLNTSEVLSELEKLKSGISDSGLNLTQDKFLTLKITVPTLEYQQLILDGIEEKLTNVAFLEAQIDDSLEQAEALRQSILKKAFSGQLVPQDPHDEPASALLARIRAENMRHTEKPKKSISRGMQNE